MAKKNWSFVLMLATWSAFALAAEADEVEEVNAFGYPDRNVVKVIESKASQSVPEKVMPDCNDEEILQQIKKFVESLIDSADTTIIGRRRNVLVLKNIKNFAPIDISATNSKNDTPVADRIIELKINNKLNESEIKACKLDSKIIGAPIYTVMYNNGAELKVEVLNLVKENNPVFGLTKKNQLTVLPKM